MGQEPGVGWVAITAAGPEMLSGKYPRTYLIRAADGMLTNLARNTKELSVAFAGATPLVWPWRVVLAGPDRERLMKSETLNDLNQ
jgi:hypothetical protein